MRTLEEAALHYESKAIEKVLAWLRANPNAQEAAKDDLLGYVAALPICERLALAEPLDVETCFALFSAQLGISVAPIRVQAVRFLEVAFGFTFEQIELEQSALEALKCFIQHYRGQNPLILTRDCGQAFELLAGLGESASFGLSDGFCVVLVTDRYATSSLLQACRDRPALVLDSFPLARDELLSMLRRGQVGKSYRIPGQLSSLYDALRAGALLAAEAVAVSGTRLQLVGIDKVDKKIALFMQNNRGVSGEQLSQFATECTRLLRQVGPRQGRRTAAAMHAGLNPLHILKTLAEYPPPVQALFQLHGAFAPLSDGLFLTFAALAEDGLAEVPVPEAYVSYAGRLARFEPRHEHLLALCLVRTEHFEPIVTNIWQFGEASPLGYQRLDFMLPGESELQGGLYQALQAGHGLVVVQKQPQGSFLNATVCGSDKKAYVELRDDLEARHIVWAAAGALRVELRSIAAVFGLLQ